MTDSMQVARWMQDSLARLEGATGLDPTAQRVSDVTRRMASGHTGEVLRGQWLGHAAHPLLTDLPLGCWLGAGLLDLFGGLGARPAAQRLVAFGLLAVPPTVATGAADYASIDSPRTRRVGVVHAAGNVGVATLYGLSWLARRRGNHGRGVVWGLGGATLAWVTGYLGGHLSFARKVGTGERGMYLPPAEVGSAAPTSAQAIVG